MQPLLISTRPPLNSPPRVLTFGDGSQHEDAGFFDDPLGVEEQLFEQGEDVKQQLVPEDISQHVQSCSGTLA